MADPAPHRQSKARVMVGTRVHSSTRDTIDRLAKQRGVSRGVWLRLAIERVVKAETDKDPT